MCGRFAQAASPEAIAELFDLPASAVPPYSPRYNLAPTQPALVLRRHPHTGQKELTFLVWGLIPSWAKDPSIGNKLINARAETLADKPAFRAAFRRRRCLVPADGFYEWKKTGAGKQPYFIARKDGRPMALAGLCEHWESPDGSVIESLTLITTDMTLRQAAQLLVDDPNEMLAVVQDQQLLGVVTDWDITHAIAQGLKDTLPVSQIMSRDVITVGPDATIPQVLELLETHEITAMPVVEDGDVIGVISSHLLARKTLSRLLQG